MLRKLWITLTWVFNTQFSHVLSADKEPHNCAILEESSLVPKVSSLASLSERIGFDLEFERLAAVLQSGNPRNFAVLPENKNLIKTKNLQTCLRIGRPIAWHDYKSFRETVPGDVSFIMEGVLGKINTKQRSASESGGKTTVHMEACMFANVVYFGSEQCAKKISTLSTTAGVGSSLYGDVNNKLIVPIIVSNNTSFVTVNEENTSQTDFLCQITPLAKSLLNFDTTTKQIYCSIESLMDILSPVNHNTEHCASLNYRLSRTQLQGLKIWEPELAKTCEQFPSFTCKNTKKRASILGSIITNTVGKAGSKLATAAVDKLLKEVKSSKFKSKGIQDEVLFKGTLTSGQVLLSMRLENKFSAFTRQNKVFANKLQSWVRMLTLEARLTLQAFHEKYRLVLDKLTSDKLSCSLNGDGVSFICSRNALLDGGNWAQIDLKTDKLKFGIGKIFFINCLEKDGVNFVGNRNVFLEFNQQFVNENVSVPKFCLGQDSFDQEVCGKFFTPFFIRNEKVADSIEIMVVNRSTIQLSSNKEFSIATTKEKSYTPSKLFEVEKNQFPIIVSGAQGSAKITSKRLNKLAYASVQQRIMQAMPQLREFAMLLSERDHQQFRQTNQTFGTPYHYATIGLGIMATLWLLAQLMSLCAGLRSRYKFKKNWKRKACSSRESLSDCHMPFIHKQTTFDRTKYREQLEKYVTSLSNDDSNLTNQADPSETKLFNLIQKSMDRVEQQALEWFEADRRGKKDLLFEIGFCLYEDLNRRMCLCSFPVHVCLNDVTLRGKWDGGRRMRTYLKDKLLANETEPKTVSAEQEV